jgi:hypothetical protein
MRRICEYTCDFAPTEYLIISAIGVGVTTPVIGKVSAICLAFLLSQNPDMSGRRRDKIECCQPKSGCKGTLLSKPVKDMDMWETTNE